MIKVCKFGGTSMAEKSAIEKVKNIILSDDARKYIVVSAPGKRNKSDIKITDTLYKTYDELIATGKIDENFSLIKERFIGIVKELELSLDIEKILAQTEKEIIENKSQAFTASRGEYLSAIVMANYLGFEFIDATELVRFDSEGKLNDDYTNDKVKMKLKGKTNVVIPGFYGKNSAGEIVTFSRGGSDITGSIIARGVKADLYENWTDVSGFLMCDPRIVPDAEVIKQITYKELRELSYMGASVLHAEAIFPVQKEKIPINIRNTFRPEDPGTLILPNELYDTNSNEIITGVTGKKNFTVIFIEKAMMNYEVGFIRKVLSVIEHHNLCIEHIPSGIDTISVVIETDKLKDGVLGDIVDELRESINPDYIHVLENVSLVATVGHGMKKRIGTAAQIFNALAEAKVNIVMIDQGSSELNIIIGVANEDYEKCIRTIYNVFKKN